MTSHYWWTTPTSLLDRYKSSSQKQMPKKKKTINTNGLICLRQNSKIPFNQFPYNMTKKKKKNGKNLKLIFHLSVSPWTIHVVKLIPCLSSKQRWQRNEKWRLPCHKTTDNSNLAKHAPCTSLLSSQDKSQKFLHDTRETSPLTALLFSQFVLSSCLRTAHTERLCC